MARLEGLEPPTFWFVAKYSNPTELQAQTQRDLVYHSNLFMSNIISLCCIKTTEALTNQDLFEKMVRRFIEGKGKYMEEIKIVKCRKNAIIPTRGTEGSAGYDLYACLDQNIEIKFGDLVKIPTGISIEIPKKNFSCANSSFGFKIFSFVAFASKFCFSSCLVSI